MNRKQFFLVCLPSGKMAGEQCFLVWPTLPRITLILFFSVGKRRRVNADFPGADIILKQISEKPSRKRVGIISSGAPARGRYIVVE